MSIWLGGSSFFFILKFFRSALPLLPGESTRTLLWTWLCFFLWTFSASSLRIFLFVGPHTWKCFLLGPLGATFDWDFLSHSCPPSLSHLHPAAGGLQVVSPHFEVIPWRLGHNLLFVAFFFSFGCNFWLSLLFRNIFLLFTIAPKLFYLIS